MLQRLPHGFLPNMKLEVVDKRNPRLIRVATIIDVDDQRIKVHVWISTILYWRFPYVSCETGFRGSDFLSQQENQTSLTSLLVTRLW